MEVKQMLKYFLHYVTNIVFFAFQAFPCSTSTLLYLYKSSFKTSFNIVLGREGPRIIVTITLNNEDWQWKIWTVCNKSVKHVEFHKNCTPQWYTSHLDLCSCFVTYTHSSRENVLTQTSSSTSHKLTRASALPVAKYLKNMDKCQDRNSNNLLYCKWGHDDVFMG